jgi:hypothetical protein
VRHVVIHGEYLDPRVFQRLDRFVADNFAHASRRVDGTVVTYALRRPDPGLWPERYIIDFGSAHREFSLLVGWWSNEQWGPGGPTMQWTSDRESSLILSLREPVDRVLEVRMRPLVYPGSPPQTVSLDVNGTLRAKLVLEPEWAVYRVTLPATSFRSGRNTLTFRYGYALAPASVIPGSSDERTLAVAFDALELTPAQ